MNPEGYFNFNSKPNFKNVSWMFLEAAEEMLTHLQSIVDEFGQVTIAEFYDCLSIESSFRDYKWGWTDLSDLNIMSQEEGGFILTFPEPSKIN